MIDDECRDTMKNVIALITARVKDDEGAAKAVFGWKDSPNEDEIRETGDAIISLLFGMTDFAISQLQVLAMVTGCPLEKLIEVLGVNMAMAIDGE